jgi:hypothetical protein
MSDNPTSPLLGPSHVTTENGNRPASIRSKRSARSADSSESTPLLSRNDHDDVNANRRYNGNQTDPNDADDSPAASSLRSLSERRLFSGDKKSKSKWPTLVALLLLTVLVLTIMAVGFFAPAVVEEYAKEAAVFEPTDVSIDSFTPTGIRARIQGTFVLDASRVPRRGVRDVGRMVTWFAREVESGESKVKVYLPEYGNVLLGTATVPHMVLDIRNGAVNLVDIVTDLEPGEFDGIRRLANDWLEGRLGQLRMQGKAAVAIKSGIFSLGIQKISETFIFEGHTLYSLFFMHLLLSID